MSSSESVEVPSAFVCYRLEATTAFDHIRRVMALVDRGVLNRNATLERLAAVAEMAHSETVSVAEIIPANQLLPRGARPFGWVDATGSRSLPRHRSDVDLLAALVCELGAGSSAVQATVVDDGNVWAQELRISLEWVWSENHPGKGQSAATALVVQDRFGGELVCAVNEGVIHHFNRFGDGTVLDLTRDRFTMWDPSPSETCDRETLVAARDVAQRYSELRDGLERYAEGALCGTL